MEPLRVFGPTGIRVGDNWMKGNDSLINELEILNQPPFIWPLADSKNKSVIGA
jgi:hypothetical protein